ncbi:hypothetical protein BGX28_009859 [Mortierella sp. GBA30]|nr:hypothetical protein BGX28_009859 [Mortierella sp. GBA30]
MRSSRSKEFKPIGAASSLKGLKEVFKQLGMEKDFHNVSRPLGGLHVYDDELNKMGSFWIRHPYGSHGRMCCRPDLINLLMSRIRAHKVHFDKCALTTTQDENDHDFLLVRLYLLFQLGRLLSRFLEVDNTSYKGTLLAGADGAYSSIRQNMYNELEKAGTSPKEDSKPMGY